LEGGHCHEDEKKNTNKRRRRKDRLSNRRKVTQSNRTMGRCEEKKRDYHLPQTKEVHLGLDRTEGKLAYLISQGSKTEE